VVDSHATSNPAISDVLKLRVSLCFSVYKVRQHCAFICYTSSGYFPEKEYCMREREIRGWDVSKDHATTIVWTWFTSRSRRVVVFLEKALYNDYLRLVVSNKQQGRSQRINQQTWKISKGQLI